MKFYYTEFHFETIWQDLVLLTEQTSLYIKLPKLSPHRALNAEFLCTTQWTPVKSQLEQTGHMRCHHVSGVSD